MESAIYMLAISATNRGWKTWLPQRKLAARTNRRVRLYCSGIGNQRASLQAKGASVSVLEFLSPVDENELPAAPAQLTFVGQRTSGFAQMSVPSKLTSYFSAGGPILLRLTLDSPPANSRPPERGYAFLPIVPTSC